MRKLLLFLLLSSTLGHAVITIVQEKHAVLASGSGTISFVAPTTLGNSVIILRALCSPDTNQPILSDSDNAGNLYNSYNAAFIDQGGAFCKVEVFAAFSNTTPRTPYPASMQTLTVTQSSGLPYTLQVWMLEVSNLLPPVSGSFINFLIGNPTPVPPSMLSPPTSTQILAPFTPDPSNTDVFHDRLFLAIAAQTSVGITSVASPWTLLTAQNGFAPAYRIVPAGTLVTPQAVFTNSSSALYSSQFVIALANPSSSGGGCPGIPSSTLLSACLSGVALAGGNAGWQAPTAPRLTITKATLAGGTIGSAYSDTLTAVNGVQPYTWSIAFGTLPPGLSLNSATGAITGTPTATGVYNFTALVFDSSTPTAQTATKDISISVTCAALSITSTSPLPPGTTGSLYSFQFQSQGGLLPLTWTGASIPAGLALSTSGLLSGTPTGSGSFTFNVTATDSCTPTAQFVTLPFSLTLNSDVTITTTSPLPDGTEGQAYSVQLAAAGGVAPYTWTVSAGSLPAGLTLGSNGTIAGTPTLAGTFNFTARAQGSSGSFSTKPFTLTIDCPAFSVTSTSPLPDATQGSPYNFAFQSNGGVAPVAWTSGTLPGGLVLSPAGVLSGTPSVAGTFTFNVTATDSCAPTPQAISQLFTITINSPLVITTATPLPDGTEGQAYNVQLQAQGGISPFGWVVQSGLLPSGETLDPTTGIISGTPTTAGTYGFTIQVQEAALFHLNDDDSLTGWSTCVKPGCDPGGTNAPQSTTLALVATPSLDGSAIHFGFTSVLSSVNALWPRKYGADNNAKRFTWGKWIYLPGSPLPTQQELDIFRFDAVQHINFMFGSQCNRASGFWDVWRQDTTSWVGTTLPCTLTAAAWHYILVSNHIGSGNTLVYDYISIDGVLTSWSITEPSGPLNPTFASTTGSQFQMNLQNANTVNGYMDESVVIIQDSLGQTATKTFTETVSCPAFDIVSTSPLPNATQGSAYTFQMQSSGGIVPITWTESGTLPTGMTFSSTGVLSGTPVNFGSFLITASATDSCLPQATVKQKPFALTVSPNSGPLAISTTSPLPAGTEGVAYNLQLAATGGTSPYTFAVTSGSLPAGLSLSAAGVITGTPTSAGTASFTVTVTDNIGTTSPKTFALTINCPTLTITSATPLPSATESQAYSFQLASSGGIAPIAWTVASGALPAGLTLASSGLLAGTPTAPGTFNFTLRATDSCSPTPQTPTKAFSLVVNPAPIPLVISSTSPLPAGTEGTAYSTQLAATGGTTPYTWSLSAGTLPTGTTLSSAGLISGTPTATGIFSFTIRVTDSLAATTTKPFTITITCTTLAITSTSPLSNGTVGQAYSFQFTASGGKLPVTWSLASGTLPAGLTLSSAGLLSGTPTTTATSTFGIRATDSCSPTPQTAINTFSVTINPAPVPLSILTTSPLPAGTQGQAYSTQLQATGGTSPYTWTISAGTLPTGLSLNTSTGVISGTPTTLSSVSVTFRVTDAVAATTTKPLSFSITCPTLTLVSTSPLPNGTQNSPYSFQFQASGGITPYTWTRTGGAFPTGLSLASSGLLSGTPTASGGFSPVVQVADSCSTPQTTSNTFALTIAPAVVPLVIVTNTPLPSATVGVAYSTTVSATGGTLPYFWSVISGALPAGLTLNSTTGVISGTPTTSQTTTPTIQVTDNLGASTTKAFSITVSCPPLSITSTSPLPQGTQGSPYSFQFTSAGGIAPRTWSLLSGTLPVGLTLSSTGLLSGTPTSSGVSGFTVQVVDSCSTPQNATLVVSLTINAAPNPLTITTTSPLPSGIVGQFYTTTIAATGGTPPYTNWIVSSGALPSGLTLHTLTGVIDGTPTLVQTTTPTIQVQDSVPNTATKPFTIVIATASSDDSRYCGSNELPIGNVSDLPAQPIQKCVYTPLSATPATGPVKTVCSSGCDYTTVQAAVNAAACGWTIKIKSTTTGTPTGTQLTYSGRVTIPATSCTSANWIIMETDQASGLPVQGTRISPGWAGTPSLPGRPSYNQPASPGIYLPKLINSTTNQQTILCTAGMSHWRIIGLEVTSGSGVQILNSLIACNGTDHVFFDRMLVHGGNNANWQDKDGITVGINLGGSTYAAVINSYIGDIHCRINTCTDSYAVFPGGSTGTTSGPLKTVNNFEEASGETCGVSGGGGVGTATLPSTDWEMRRNHCFKPTFWKTNDPTYFGQSFNVKNAYEMKNTNRALVEGNIFDSAWSGQSDQFGTLVNFGSKNQSSFYTGVAKSDGAGTLTWISGQVFHSTIVSPNCAKPNSCLVTYNGTNYHATAFIDNHHISVTPVPATLASGGFKAFDPGLNPNAIVSNLTVRYNYFTHGSRGLAIFAFPSDGGDLSLGDSNISVNNNMLDDISTKWNDSNGACCFWAETFQVQNSFANPNNIHDITFDHNTALSFQNTGGYVAGGGPTMGFGFQSASAGTVRNLRFTNNISTAGWTGGTSVCNSSSANVLQRMQCYDQLSGVAQNTFCFDHNGLATTTQAPIANVTNNAPYPAAGQSPGCGFTTTGQIFVSSFAAIQFINLNAAVGGNYQLQLASPFHNAASDGSDIGVHWTQLQNAIAGVQ